MAFQYTRKGPFVDVPYPKTPPAGAKLVKAEFLNGVEDALAAIPSDFASREDLALASSTGLIEDPARPGIYLMGSDTQFTEDPARPGIYTIGV